MNGIAKIDTSAGLAAFAYPDDHPVVALWVRPMHGFLYRLQSALQTMGAHPARTLVLLPYAQLRPLASRLWSRTFGDGFAPRFETTMNWCNTVGTFQPGPTDVRMDAAWDLLTAQNLLALAGLAQQQSALAGLLVQTVHQLAPLAAACAPMARQEWAEQSRVCVAAGMAGTALQWEAAVARIAVEWAAQSGFASDVLFEPNARADVDLLVMVQGISADPLAAGLADAWGAKLLVMQLDDVPMAAAADRTKAIVLHACSDAEDEAQCCAAQALRHIADGTLPVALVSSDRALTRRVRALLDGCGVAIRDENGWKLSTSYAAAGVMALLQASAWSASSDQVLSWLKHTPIEFSAQRDALESALRREQLRDWRHVAHATAIQKRLELQELVQTVDHLRASLKGLQTLAQWLGLLRAALTECRLWVPLQADGAGLALLQALRLQDGDATAHALLSESLWSQRRMNLAEFTQWVNEVLESKSFKPDYPEQEQLVILPMSQMLGRPFAAVLLAGCDEVRLLASPEPDGLWTAVQRLTLGLPGRSDMQAHTQAAWHSALRTPVCDVFWRTSDEAGEALLPSPLVQLLQCEPGVCASAPDARLQRPVSEAPTLHPEPSGALLPVTTLTQGAYDDLRQCPYRFFALRQLGLQPIEELESEVDKRDFGVWLHGVLQRFHVDLASQPSSPRAERLQLLEAAGVAVTREMALPEGEFLPFAASWPAVRSGYLDWLERHEKEERAAFQSGETALRQPVGPVTLLGRVDRIDVLPDGTLMVLDYKTESLDKTRARIKEPLEDTQMAFYAALLPHDTLRGAYVHVSEKLTARVEQTDVVPARDALIEGIVGDMQRIAEGSALSALGQGAACDYCHARGLCRKDFWP